MKKSSVAPIIAVVIIIAGIISYLQFTPNLLPPESEPEFPSAGDTITIAAFNIQVFGRTKREKTEVMEVLAETVREFDVVLVQEIRDSSETTAPIFLEVINGMEGPGYAFIRSERLGRTTSKEAYAYFYNTQTVSYLDDTAHVWDDIGDVFEREPYIVSFIAGEFDFTLVGIHIKPDDAENEIGNLTIVFETLKESQEDQDIIALGDFNADGSYFDEDAMDSPLRDQVYFWTVSNEVDTMTKTDWTYDRIVMMNTTYNSEYIHDSTSVYYFNEVYGLTQELTEDVSDHFPVFAEFRVDLPDDD
ncbi:MAG: endonuclease/exonuclease/phosphatase family protein [Candidatus Bathyarchaeota archaeon]|nr:endonuclease/exonuclease/phosphatase family protein [Candidatus Bathyarchaeota archaeon]